MKLCLLIRACVSRARCFILSMNKGTPPGCARPLSPPCSSRCLFVCQVAHRRSVHETHAGTLDYMAPEVLTNPCTRLEEQSATKEQLDLRNIVPYTSKVDVWATGVLAHELVTGRPPFEVENEAQTVALILQSDNIAMDKRFSPEWADFIRCARLPWPPLLVQFCCCSHERSCLTGSAVGRRRPRSFVDVCEL